MGNDLKILIADDHGLVRDGLRMLLKDIDGVAVVGEAENGREAVKQTQKLKPDIILMDIAMSELNGLEATMQIKQDNDAVQVIMVSMYSSDEFVRQALKAGALGYLLKNASSKELEEAIRAVSQGSIYLTPSVSKVLTDYVRDPGKGSPTERLTSRQREVLQLIAEGFTTPQIALKLHLSESTVEKHRINLMKELDIHNIPDLVRFAIRQGLVSLDE